MPKPNADKVLATNVAKLKQKYGAAGWKALKQGIDQLIAADGNRGLTAVLVDLSSSAAMTKFKASAVPAAKAADPKANKQAIDKLYDALRPDYLVLLGATDVIAHQDLKNPAYSPEPDGDDDKFAWSDLPYACDAPYSSDIRDFLAPSRVVGRLPDVNGGNDANYLLDLLNTAATYSAQPLAAYNPFLGITADVWKGSTTSSLHAIFGAGAAMKVSPPDGPAWSAADWSARSHFINCHGAPADWRFYGQVDDNYPVAHDATQVRGKLAAGTVLAAECCYGAELYDPTLAAGQLGMCNTYLGNQAYAYFGSSTIAYGPSATNDWADLICRYFLQQVRSGASVGRACLQARIEYVKQAHTLTATDLKTLAQFNLMADPALTPVIAPADAPKVVTAARGAKALLLGAASVQKSARYLRRETLHEAAKAARATVHVASGLLSGHRISKGVQARLLAVARQAGLAAPLMMSFNIEGPTLARKAAAFAKSAKLAAPHTVHLLMKRTRGKTDEPRIVRIRGLEAVQYDDTLEVRHFVSR